MKSLKYKFSWGTLFGILLFAANLHPNDLKAQQIPAPAETQLPDTLSANTTNDSAKDISYYEQYVRRYCKFWSRLIPSQFKIQYAGSIGIFSASAGWHYGYELRTWETDVFLGIVPKFQTRCSRATLTLKQSYVPFRFPLHEQFDFEPLACGLFFSTIFGEEFWGTQPSKYPKHYYGFSTKIRSNIFLGERLRYRIPSNIHKRHNSISVYYELSTCDLYLVSYATNKYLSLWDILSLSFGMKFELF